VCVCVCVWLWFRIPYVVGYVLGPMRKAAYKSYKKICFFENLIMQKVFCDGLD